MNAFANMDPDSRDAAMKIYKVAKGMTLDEIREKSEKLPPEWEERANDDGFVYYVNTETNESQSIHPKSGRRRFLEGDLPVGWERVKTKSGKTAFINQQLDIVTCRDPRLEKRTKPNLEPQGKPSAYAKDVTAMEILSGLDMTGWVVMITGASSGIGLETARSLAAHSAHVVMAVRDVEKAEEEKAEICSQLDEASIDIIECDLASFSSIERCAKSFLDTNMPLHLLILNAAVYGPPYGTTEETGLETTFAVNHMGHFYLTKLLKQRLIESKPAQVIVITSEQHRKAADIGHFDSDGPAELMLTLDKLSSPSKNNYFWSYSYFLSKLCNLWFCMELNSKMMMPYGVTANAVNPGTMVQSNLPRESCMLRALYRLVRPWTKTVPQAAASVVYCAVLPEMVGGQYIDNCCPISPHPAVLNRELQARLWEISEEIVQNYWKKKEQNGHAKSE